MAVEMDIDIRPNSDYYRKPTPETPDDIYEQTWILVEGTTEETVINVKDRAARFMENSISSWASFPFLGKTFIGDISASNVARMCNWIYASFNDENGDRYICKSEDIKENNNIDPLDILVLRNDVRFLRKDDLPEYTVPKWSIVTGLSYYRSFGIAQPVSLSNKDLDNAVYPKSIDRDLYLSVTFAENPETFRSIGEWESAFDMPMSHTLPPFQLSRIRDLGIGSVPGYNIDRDII